MPVFSNQSDQNPFFRYNYKQLPSLQGRISVLIYRQILIFTADRIYGNQE